MLLNMHPSYSKKPTDCKHTWLNTMALLHYCYTTIRTGWWWDGVKCLVGNEQRRSGKNKEEAPEPIGSLIQHDQTSPEAPTPPLAPLNLSGSGVRGLGVWTPGCVCVWSSSGWFLINFPELLLDLGGQGVEEVLLHHQARPLELPALAQLHRQALQPVAPQLQLRQRRQLAEARRHWLQAVVAQVERAQLLALEQLVGQALDLQRRGGRMEGLVVFTSKTSHHQ